MSFDSHIIKIKGWLEDTFINYRTTDAVKNHSCMKQSIVLINEQLVFFGLNLLNTRILMKKLF